MATSHTWQVVCTLGLTLFVSTSCYSQSADIQVGLRAQKSFGLYLENGIAVQASWHELAYERLYWGAAFVTSRLGSALNSNAIKQDNYLVSAAYYFRHGRVLKPFAGLQTGYFRADYEDEMFEMLDNQSLLLAATAGLAVNFSAPIQVDASLGYNVVSGDGVSGPGTVFPVFLQFTLYYLIP